MTIISLVISDLPDGSVATKFVSNRQLPLHMDEYTPAEVFATELQKEIEKLEQFSGVEEKSTLSGSYPEDAGAIPAPATNV